MNNLQYYFFQARLITALKGIISGLGDDHAECEWCADLDWYQTDEDPHHIECRVGKTETLIAEIEEIHRLEAV